MKEKVEAKNGLENLCYQMKNTLNEEIGKNLPANDKTEIENIVKNTLDWLDTHQDATKEEYETKQKELENKVQPIFAKMYQQGQQGGMPNMTQQQYQQKSKQEGNSGNGKGPIIEEVD